MKQHRTIVVVPCYNEERRLPSDRFSRYLAQNPSVDFLFVDDGSLDATGDLLDSLAAGHPGRCFVLKLEENSGKAEAVRRGFLAAFERDPEFVAFWDADLSTPLDAVQPMMELLQENSQVEIILGSRVKLLGRHIQRKMSRHYLGRVFATVVSMVLNLGVYDTQCGAKMFRCTDELHEYFETPFASRWIFDVEILARALRTPARRHRMLAQERIHEFPLLEWRDVGGSKLNSLDFFRAALELAGITWRYQLWKHWKRGS